MVAPADATVHQCVIWLSDPAAAHQRPGSRSRLGWLLREFVRFGVSEFLLLSDQTPAELRAELGADLEPSPPRPARITSAVAPAAAGSGGGLLAVRAQLAKRFLWCDAGVLFDWNMAGLLADAAADGPEVVGRVARFGSAMDCHAAVFRRELLGHLLPACSLAADVVPQLISRDLARVTQVAGWFDTADDAQDSGGDGSSRFSARQGPPAPRSRRSRMAGPPDPAAAGGHPPQSASPGFSGPGLSGPGLSGPSLSGPSLSGPGVRLRRRALFLDRDGVLNIDHGYIGSRDRFEWVDGAPQAIRAATQAGWHVFVVTNQSGVARGLYPEAAVGALMDWIAGQARAAGGTIDDWRFCPFHPQAPLDAYRQDHPWRKPRPGMLLDLIEVWQLDPRRAVLIGDQDSDMRAAAAAGVEGHLFQGGNLLEFMRPILRRHAQI